MSIAMEKFASEGHFATYDPFKYEHRRVSIFQLQCRCCGYEPEAVVTPPRYCPKCRGSRGSVLRGRGAFWRMRSGIESFSPRRHGCTEKAERVATDGKADEIPIWPGFAWHLS